MKPKYSVIIPHYRQLDQLSLCLQSLNRQSIDNNEFEIIVIENEQFSEKTQLLIKKYPAVKWLVNNEKLNPYTSRNIGIKESLGEVLCFLDASCQADTHWLEEINTLLDSGAVIIAGHFEVTPFNEALNSWVHPLLYLNNEKNVKNQFGVAAGNLVVHKNLFSELGGFPDEINSGNDILWTKKALKKGYKIHYGDLVKVLYPGYEFEQLKKKVIKYSGGTKKHFKPNWKTKLLGLLPMRTSNFNNALRYRKIDTLSIIKKLKLYYWIWKIKCLYAKGL